MSYHGRGKRFYGHGRGGGGRGGGGRGGGGRRYFDDDKSSSDGGDRNSQRPPPGLKGKEIGLWFARRSRAKKEMLDKQQRPVVKMDSRQERNIRNLLENFGSENSSDSNDHRVSGAVSDGRKPVDWFDVKPEEAKDFEMDDSQSDKMHSQEKTLKQENPTEENLVPSMSEMRCYVREEIDFDIDMEMTGCDSNFRGERSSEMDAKFTQEYENKMKNPKYQKMLQARKKLPAFNMKNDIVSLIHNHQVVVISGETGCGKTTQIPQFILDDFLNRGIPSQCRVVCTQPRRISAISVAQRVADERGVRCGQGGEVGYQIRLERELCRDQGSILFCTTGIVLKWLESDPLLMRATHIVLDEIHERDLLSDFLMIIIKTILIERLDLKVILMSATLNANMFSDYFGGCPIINIPGFTYPVREFYLEDVLEFTRFVPAEAKRQNRSFRGREQARREEMEKRLMLNWIEEYIRGNYSASTCQSLATMDHKLIDVDLVAELIKYICLHKKPGAILVFLTGWEDIRKVNDILLKNGHFNSSQFRIIPLHSLMPTVNQREVFDRPPAGVRKIILATNIAETSITIDDVVHVIDCGKIKMKNFEPDKNLTSLEPQMVSKANSRQRRGRAGRVQPGECYHLYTSYTDAQLVDYLPPEMLRTRLEELCLQIKLLKLGRIVPFVSQAIQPPSMEALRLAIEILQNLNALDQAENLLPLGKHLARMPVDPHSGKMILLGAMFSCLDPILTVAASLSFKDAFVIPLGKEKEADRQRKLLAKGSKSDHIMLINAYKGWEKAMACGYDRDYCWDNFLSPNTLKLLKDMKKQFASLIYDLGFIKEANPLNREANINSDNQNLIRAIVCAGLYPNVAKIYKPPKGNRPAVLHTKSDDRVQLHPKSVNSTEQQFEMKWLIFHQKLKTTGVFIHDCSMVSPYPLLFFGGHINIRKDGDQDCITVDDWIIFQASPKTAKLVKDLRKELDRLLEEKIKSPGSIQWDQTCKEGALMKAITDLITQDCPTDKM